VSKQAALALTFGLALTLNSASCGPTCPAGQQSCGNSNPSASAGSSGDAGASDPSTCGLLTAMTSCMKAFCAGASNPYCTCYKRGFDLRINDCKCIDFDAQDFCEKAKDAGIDGSNYDCAAASSGVSSYCVGVN
jgi:hypothetical protein